MYTYTIVVDSVVHHIPLLRRDRGMSLFLLFIDIIVLIPFQVFLYL